MEEELSSRFKIFSSILTGLFISSNIVFMILFILLLNKPLDILFSIINCTFIILGFIFSIFYLIFNKRVFKVLSDSFLIISFVFIIFILLFNNFFIFNKWIIFSIILLISLATIVLNSISNKIFGLYTSILDIFFLIVLCILYLNLFSRSFMLFGLSIISLIICIIFNLLFDRYKYNYFYSIVFYYLFIILNYIIIFVYI